MFEKKLFLRVLAAAALVPAAHASVNLIAIGSISGTYEDPSTRTATPLENGVPGNRLGGHGSGRSWPSRRMAGPSWASHASEPRA